MTRPMTMAKFWTMYRVADNGCWEWTGKPSDKGYGTVKFNGRSLKAYRVALESREPIPFDGAHALHKREYEAELDRERARASWLGHFRRVLRGEAGL